jgi:hypothetical protein
MRITYVSPLSLAKVALVLYGLLGLVFGLVFAALSLFGAALGAGSGEEVPMFGAFFGIGAVIFLPIFYGCVGAVGALVTAWLYNLVAGFVGGIEIRTESSPAA